MISGSYHNVSAAAVRNGTLSTVYVTVDACPVTSSTTAAPFNLSSSSAISVNSSAMTASGITPNANTTTVYTTETSLVTVQLSEVFTTVTSTQTLETTEMITLYTETETETISTATNSEESGVTETVADTVIPLPSAACYPTELPTATVRTTIYATTEYIIIRTSTAGDATTVSTLPITQPTTIDLSTLTMQTTVYRTSYHTITETSSTTTDRVYNSNTGNLNGFSTAVGGWNTSSTRISGETAPTTASNPTRAVIAPSISANFTSSSSNKGFMSTISGNMVGSTTTPGVPFNTTTTPVPTNTTTPSFLGFAFVTSLAPTSVSTDPTTELSYISTPPDLTLAAGPQTTGSQGAAWIGNGTAHGSSVFKDSTANTRAATGTLDTVGLIDHTTPTASALLPVTVDPRGILSATSTAQA